MKSNDPLDKLFRAAARAERENPSRPPLAMPFGWETRVLASARKGSELFSFLPLFRGALACAAGIAVLTAALHFGKDRPVDPLDYTLNYSLAAAYMR